MGSVVSFSKKREARHGVVGNSPITSKKFFGRDLVEGNVWHCERKHCKQEDAINTTNKTEQTTQIIPGIGR